MTAAVVPVAFFIEPHIDMTARFLDALHDEVDRIGVWHNGGSLADEGTKMLSIFKDVEVFNAEGWRFFQMWNAGARWAHQELGADIALILNNDISWDTGALKMLADELRDAEDDVAIMSPRYTRPFAFWCFAVRPWLWQAIDERYHTWYGDDELVSLMDKAGWRYVQTDLPIYHPWPFTTSQFVEGVEEMRLEDQRLYEAKW